MNKMTVLIAALLCVAAPATEGLAQTGTGADSSVYSAEIIGRNVHVRSGPYASAYYCVELAAPARVTVVSKVVSSEGTWLKILPPQGCYSVVAKKDVRTDPTGKTGRIIGNRVFAFAGGFPAEPGKYSYLQKALKADQSVMILGQTGQFYKIVPPSGAYFWVEAKNVKRVGPAPRPTTTAATTRRAATTQPAPPKVYKPHPDVLALQALDKELRAECLKPFKDRDYKTLLEKYQALKTTKESGVAPHVAARIKGLQTEIERQKDAESVDSVITQAAASFRDFEIARTKISTGSTTRPITGYTAKGIVAPSVIYTTDVSIGRRFVLRDEKGLRISVYLINTNGQVALADHVGKLVEVHGPIRFDRDLGMEVVDAEKVIVLAEDAPLPRPPAPTVGPRPKPEPKKTDTTRKTGKG